jgi:hypothetical protein
VAKLLALLPILLLVCVVFVSGCSQQTTSDTINTTPSGQATVTSNDACVSLGCPAGTVAVGSSQSNKYHDCTCQWAKKILSTNLVCFKSESEAQSKGYVACKVCGG